jgi:hypothetical protein
MERVEGRVRGRSGRKVKEKEKMGGTGNMSLYVLSIAE